MKLLAGIAFYVLFVCVLAGAERVKGFFNIVSTREAGIWTCLVLPLVHRLCMEAPRIWANTWDAIEEPLMDIRMASM
jgi:hypothetical protein